MADVELVIKIPESLKEEIDNYGDINRIDASYLIYATRKGKPLPKGHGRLIDADVLADGFEDNYEFCEVVNATPTIIKADKESEE